MAQLPIIMGPQGPIPTPPVTLRQQLVDIVSATNPDYTSNLPGSLVEDIVSTDVGALIIANQFMVDLINSISPFGANAFILNQLGTDVYGIQVGAPTNTSVNVIFYDASPGFIIQAGFTVTDGQHQYICQDGGVIGTDETSLPINAISSESGTWAVPAGTVNGLITSVPSTISLSVINPTNGIPSTTSEDMTSFRTRTVTAGLVGATGTDRFLKTLLWNIPGVIQRLVSVRQDIDTGRYSILVGGGDPYQVAWAIYYSGIMLALLDRPNIEIINISNTNPIVITTVNNHNLSTGMNEKLYQINGMNDVYGDNVLNGNQYPITILSPTTFSIPVDGTVLTSYINGGIVTPNLILQLVSLLSYPDTYLIPFILPAQELVTMVVSWNTDSINYVSEVAVAQAVMQPLIDYINGIYVGITPINIYEMQTIFTESVANILQAENITVLDFAISFDGIGRLPIPGTGVIYGDPFSYFYTDSNNVIVNRLPSI